MILLDTDVLVESLRGRAAAQAWFEASSDLEIFVPGIVAMELVLGCRNRPELRAVRKFLGDFDLIWPTTADFMQAYQLLITYHLSIASSIPDCLIAAMALQRSAMLYTFNTKHYRHIPELELQIPYTRS
jgi:predicted nucleic acid-binding protein